LVIVFQTASGKKSASHGLRISHSPSPEPVRPARSAKEPKPSRAIPVRRNGRRSLAPVRGRTKGSVVVVVSGVVVVVSGTVDVVSDCVVVVVGATVVVVVEDVVVVGFVVELSLIHI